MPIQTTEKIWHNGELIPWEQATIHVMSHVIHYGSSVFEGIRCYGQPHGSAVFRLPEHMQRLLDSAKIYRMEVPYTLEELCAGVVDVIEANGVAPCYIRPIILRGYGEGVAGAIAVRAAESVQTSAFAWSSLSQFLKTTFFSLACWAASGVLVCWSITL